jgi:hypothetical protein
MDKISWRELIVTNSDDDDNGTLGDIYNDSPEMLDTATVDGGEITEWPDYYLSAPGTEPDWNIPNNVDWTGFNLSNRRIDKYRN